MVPVLSSEAVYAAVPPPKAIERTQEAFEHHARGEWVMPSKVYLDAPPNGDFRAMPARGRDLALLKWVTSFPGNSDRGLPVVTGAVLLSSAETGELLAVMDAGSITALRTGAAAAVSTRALARPDATSVGIIGCGHNGGWAARCLAAAGYGPGTCADRDPERAAALADELGWGVGPRELAAAADVVVTVTPGAEPVILAAELRPGQHLAVLGADAEGKSEVEASAFAQMRLFCDEWSQAAKGGELAGPVARGDVSRADVTQLGDVLIGAEPGRGSAEEVTLFDSTGLATQDLGVAAAVYEAWRDGRVASTDVEL